jgi:hypothetical protein
MDTLIMIAIIVFFGIAALSTIAQRHGAPAHPVFVIRTDPAERLATGDNGFGIIILLLVIGVAIWLL